MSENLTFGQAVEAMNQGKMLTRDGWNGQGRFVFQQVPSEVPADIIPRMTSLPELVKQEVAGRSEPLRYCNQMAICHPDNTIDGWVASVSDSLADDWRIYSGEHVVATDTVGAADPQHPGQIKLRHKEEVHAERRREKMLTHQTPIQD